MPKINVKKALAIIQKDLQKTWAKLTFKYEVVDAEEVKITSNVTLKNVDDSILVVINIYGNGNCSFRVVFDKIAKTGESLYLINQFNDDEYYFKGFIRDDDYLEFKHICVCYDLKNLKSYAGDFLYKVANRLPDNESVIKLSQLTSANLSGEIGG